MAKNRDPWYTVMLPGESADLSELYGVFRTKARADRACEAWNAANATDGDRATVLPIFHFSDLKDAR